MESIILFFIQIINKWNVSTTSIFTIEAFLLIFKHGFLN